MRGRQFAFRASAPQLAAFEAALRSKGTVFLRYSHPSGSPAESQTLDRSSNLDPIVWLVRQDEVHGVLLRPVPGQAHWLVDQIRSPVIELSRGNTNGDGAGLGRLYYHTGYFDEHGQWVEFAESFHSWAKEILNMARRILGPASDRPTLSGVGPMRPNQESNPHT